MSPPPLHAPIERRRARSRYKTNTSITAAEVARSEQYCFIWRAYKTAVAFRTNKVHAKMAGHRENNRCTRIHHSSAATRYAANGTTRNAQFAVPSACTVHLARSRNSGGDDCSQ